VSGSRFGRSARPGGTRREGIGCRTFLTAGHCRKTAFPPGSLEADEAWVYLPHAGILPVTAIALHPDYRLAGIGFPINDVAVLKLGVPVTGIEPMPINRTDPNPFVPPPAPSSASATRAGSARLTRD
jgi:hypothetical protein